MGVDPPELTVAGVTTAHVDRYNPGKHSKIKN